jgi:hypothetical protein
MKPALRPATLFITDPRFEVWFTHLINGQLKNDSDSGRPYLEEPQLKPDDRVGGSEISMESALTEMDEFLTWDSYP